MVPAFLAVGSGANSLTVTLGNIHCIQRLTFPLLPPMLLVFCSRVTVSANGPSSPGGTESPWGDNQDLVKKLGWCDVVGSINQYHPVRRKHVWQFWHRTQKGFNRDWKVTALLFLYFLFSFPVNLFSKQVSVWFLSQEKKSCNLTIWKRAALELQHLKFPTAFSPLCAHDSCVTVIELCCGCWRGYQLSQLETPQLLDWLVS